MRLFLSFIAPKYFVLTEEVAYISDHLVFCVHDLNDKRVDSIVRFLGRYDLNIIFLREVEGSLSFDRNTSPHPVNIHQVVESAFYFCII